MAKSEEALLDVTEVIRRVLRARCGDIHLVEDLTQETLVHVAAARPRLSDDTLRAYAIVTARNTIFRHFRREATARRHAHRLVEYRGLEGPEQLSLEREETDALAVALDHLEPGDRELLLAHEVNDEPLDALAQKHHTSPRAIGMRLSRARAQMRVEFIVAFRHAGPLPVRCRNVLTDQVNRIGARNAYLEVPFDAVVVAG